MKQNQNLFNYFLSIGFILLVVAFLLLLSLISRFTLSDLTPIESHVVETKILLKDIDDIETQTKEGQEEEKTITKNNTLDQMLTQTSPIKITESSHINVNKNKSILTLFLDREINKTQNMYYIPIKDIGELEKGAALVYKIKGIVQRGTVVSTKQGTLTLLNTNTRKIDKVAQKDVLGILLLIEEK